MEGKLNVQTENIFPVIKKFLYSDHEIFLRELISNAVDATQKLKTLSTRGEFKGELGDLTIDVKIDPKKKTLTVSDRGIGMTADEVEKYINQIAFSGVTDFMEKYKDSHEQLIGHFGLGFYSAFMVSDKVEIFTKSWKDEPAQHWSCEGNPEFTMEEDKKHTDRGTDIVLHIADDCKEFLEEGTVLQLLKKYCRFMPVAIRFGEETVWVDSETDCDKDGKPKRVEKKQPRIINDPDPAWKKSPSVAHRRGLQEILPRAVPHELRGAAVPDTPQRGLPLQPDGHPLLPQGAQDHRPQPQQDTALLQPGLRHRPGRGRGARLPDAAARRARLAGHPAERQPQLPAERRQREEDLAAHQQEGGRQAGRDESKKKEGEEKSALLEEKWDDIKIFVQYGMLTDEKFCERAMKFYLLKGVDGTYYTLDSYREKIKALQTDKDKTVCYLYASDAEEEHAYIEKAKAKGYDVLLMDSPLESHFINLLEQKLEKSRFVRVDSDTVEKLIPHDDAIPEKLSKEEKEKLQPIIEGEMDKQKFTVQLESLEESDAPMQVTQSEFMRRYREMAQTSGGGMGFYGELPESYNLVVNINHPLISRVLNETDTEKQKALVHQLTDLALLANGLLKGEALSKFLQRSVQMRVQGLGGAFLRRQGTERD